MTMTKTKSKGAVAIPRDEPFTFETTINEFGQLLWAFTLYCAGRQTYAPSICEDIIKANKDRILLPWCSLIISEIEGRFAKTFLDRIAAEQAQKAAREAGDPNWWEKGYKGGSLGADFDENGWMLAIQELEKATPTRELVEACWDGIDAPITARFGDSDDFWFMVGGALRQSLCGKENGAVFEPDALTEFVSRHMDDINDKWVTNMLRDLGWDFYASYNGNEDFAEKWAGLRGILEGHATDERR